jgi:hypothetical protein
LFGTGSSAGADNEDKCPGNGFAFLRILPDYCRYAD